MRVDRDRYQEEGILFPLRVFGSEEIAGVRGEFDSFDAAEGRDRPQGRNRGRHLDLEFAWRMATDQRVLDIMRQLMGPDLVIFGCDFFCKYGDPTTEAFVAWHQDVTYWGIEPAIAHTAWIAIDDSNVSNGCMRVVPGSNLRGLVTHGKSDRAGNILSINQEIPDELVDSSEAVDVVLQAGEVSIHDGRIFHASMPNRSSGRRCGMTVRFITPDVTVVADSPHKGMVLVSGRDTSGKLALEDPPFPLPAAS
jgi:non-heme Fe2+,alpha-ketoglutarate-dependent halogenase